VLRLVGGVLAAILDSVLAHHRITVAHLVAGTLLFGGVTAGPNRRQRAAIITIRGSGLYTSSAPVRSRTIAAKPAIVQMTSATSGHTVWFADIPTNGFK